MTKGKHTATSVSLKVTQEVLVRVLIMSLTVVSGITYDPVNVSCICSGETDNGRCSQYTLQLEYAMTYHVRWVAGITELHADGTCWLSAVSHP